MPKGDARRTAVQRNAYLSLEGGDLPTAVREDLLPNRRGKTVFMNILSV